MKIKDYLGISEEENAVLKAISSFPKKRDIHRQSCMERFSPFENTRMKRISLQAQTDMEGNIPYPVAARLLISYTCTHSCSGCPYGLNRKGEKDFFDSNHFKSLLRSLQSLKVKFIDLSRGGEPTTHPEFIKFAQMSMKENFYLSLLSNGAWPDSRIAELLVCGFSHLTVNLDASDDETYNRIHHPPESTEFQRVLENIERVVTERESVKSSLVIGAEVSLGQTNMNFMEQITCLARDMGMDFIRFRINRWSSDHLLPDQIERTSQLITELRNAVDPFPIYGEIKSTGLSPGCRISLVQLTIDPSGNAYPCPYFEQFPGITSFGNILAQPPEELWFGLEHRRAVERLKECDYPVKDCRWHMGNDFIRSSDTK